MRQWTVSVLLAVCACQFDARVPPTASVRCDDGACPPGFTCRPRVGLCVADGAQSGEAPRLVAATVSPARAASGAELQVSLRVSKPLVAPPLLSLLGAAGPRRVPLETQEGDEYRFRELVDRAVHAEGPAQLTADLVDTSGNEAVAQPVGVATFDFTAPQPTAARFTAPRTPPDRVLVVRPDERVSVRIVLSEDVRPGSSLVATSPCPLAPSFTAELSQGGLLDFSTPLIASPGCEYALTLRGLVDVAGNAAADAPLDLRVAVDGTAPSVTNLEVLRVVDGGAVPQTTFSRAPGFDAFVFRYAVDSTAVLVTARLDDTPLTGCACAGGRCACPGVVGAADVEGPHTLSVTAQDAAGNVGAASRQVRFDFSPPGLVAASRRVSLDVPPGCPRAAVAALREGGTGLVDFSLDEEGTARVAAVPPDVTFTGLSATSTHSTFRLSSAGASPGVKRLVVQATDGVGNGAELPLGLDVRVDTAPPAAPDVDSPVALTYVRAPWGTRDGGPAYALRGEVGAVAPGALLQVFDGPGPLAVFEPADGGFVLPLNTVDRPGISVRAIDDACNASALVAVRNVEWLATLNGKIVGRSFENPHTLEVRESFSVATTQPQGAAEVAPASGLTQRGGLAWTERGRSPSPRSTTGLVYDRARRRAVLFGGGQTGTFENDVWERDGRTGVWSSRTPSPRPNAWPSPRRDHGLVYDEGRQTVVLFGGATATGDDSELWEWTGATASWRNRTPSTRPSAWPSGRHGHSLAYDAARRRVVLFGGIGLGITLRDTWEWDGARGTWEDRTPTPVPTAWPSGRLNAAMAYDVSQGRVLLFGGYRGASTVNQELWAWSGANGTWSQVPAPALGVPWPTARSGHALVFDAARNRTALFGGLRSGNALSDEVWEWDGTAAAWTNRTPTPRPLEWPQPRQSPGLAFDADESRLVLFGGNTSFGTAAPSGETWELDVDAGTWANRTLSRPPGSWPRARMELALAFDEARDRVVLFGGRDSSSAVIADLWEWSGSDGRWTDRTPSPLPPSWPSARHDHALTYDATRQRVVLFGGYNASLVPNAELWEWEGDAGTWQLRTPVGSAPSPRNGHGLAYDRGAAKVVLFGGAGVGGVRNAEVWDWDGSAATWALATSGPSARQAAALVFDPGRRKVVLHGGVNTTQTLADLWERDSASGAWVDRTPPPGSAALWPSPITAAGFVADPRGPLLRFGGGTGAGVSRELWAWDGDAGAWTNRSPDPLPPNWPSARISFGAAGHGAHAPMVVFGGYLTGAGGAPSDELWELRVDDSARPGIVARFNFSLAGAEPGAVITEAHVHAVAGGESGAPAVSGARLFASEGDVLMPEAEHLAQLTVPIPLDFRTTTPDRLATLFEGPQRVVTVAVTPVARSAVSREGAVRLDWVQLTVRYRRP